MGNKPYAFILGGSDGIGYATALKLSEHGWNFFIVHRSRKLQMPEVEERFNRLKANGANVVAVNVSAVSDEGRQTIADELSQKLFTGSVGLMLHSIADGSVRPVIGENSLDAQNINYTFSAMAESFVYWAKLLLEKKLFSANARIIGLTSEGSQHVLKNYAAVGMAKASLEAAMRYLAAEFAQFGITVNLLSPGVTDTKALSVFPNREQLLEQSKNRNPFRRLTTPSDVANAVYLLTLPEAAWINGAIIPVDGGEQNMIFT